MKKTIVAAVLFAASAGAVHAAGPVESACLRSERPGATPALCGCIQNVADNTLDRRDQRRAVQFFKDPDKAQQVRTSTSAEDNEFWARYRNFGAQAEAYCAR